MQLRFAVLLPPATELLVTASVVVCVPMASRGGAQRTSIICELPGAIVSVGEYVQFCAREQLGLPAGMLMNTNHVLPVSDAALTCRLPAVPVLLTVNAYPCWIRT